MFIFDLVLMFCVCALALGSLMTLSGDKSISELGKGIAFFDDAKEMLSEVSNASI